MKEVLVQIEAGPPGPDVVERQIQKHGGEILKRKPETPPPTKAGAGLATRGDQYIAVIPYSNGKDLNNKIKDIKDFPEKGSITMWFYQGRDPRKPNWDKIALGSGILGAILGAAGLIKA